MRSPCTTTERPHSPRLERACTQQRRPSTATDRQILKKGQWATYRWVWLCRLPASLCASSPSLASHHFDFGGPVAHPETGWCGFNSVFSKMGFLFLDPRYFQIPARMSAIHLRMSAESLRDSDGDGAGSADPPEVSGYPTAAAAPDLSVLREGFSSLPLSSVSGSDLPGSELGGREGCNQAGRPGPDAPAPVQGGFEQRRQLLGFCSRRMRFTLFELTHRLV